MSADLHAVILNALREYQTVAQTVTLRQHSQRDYLAEHLADTLRDAGWANRAEVLSEAADKADEIAHAMGSSDESWSSRARWAVASCAAELRRMARTAGQGEKDTAPDNTRGRARLNARAAADAEATHWRRLGMAAPAERAAEIERLRIELAKYVGKEPTVAEEMAYLNRCLDAVHEVCDAAEKQATRWEHPLPVPEWVGVVREAADGERPENPNDNRRRIYIDGEGNGWISTCVDDGVECVVPVQPAAEAEQEITELDNLREIGRCW